MQFDVDRVQLQLDNAQEGSAQLCWEIEASGLVWFALQEEPVL